MKIFENNILEDERGEGRPIPETHAVHFWLDDTSYLAVTVGRDGSVEVRGVGNKTQIKIEPEVSNTIRISLV